MKILSIECSASPVSAAITENGSIISSAFSNTKVTHSETLMPTVNAVLKFARLTLSDIDGFAVAAGPGSFTGVRIGIAAVKGMAASTASPCAGVSTLEAMAHLQAGVSGIICPVMDARRNQVYNALFKYENGRICRLCEDRAISCADLAAEIAKAGVSVTVCGDGTDVFIPFTGNLTNVTAADAAHRFQNATGVAAAAERLFAEGKTVTPDKLLPVYLRMPQAERELKEKLAK